MTKRRLESLPQDEQDAILGAHDPEAAIWESEEPRPLFVSAPVPAKCERCGDSLPANWGGALCEYCQMSHDRRRKCDAHYGWH